MQNPVFDSLVDSLSVHFGTGHPLVTGVRFQSARRGRLSVYHSNVAAGNQAEVAFEPATMAKRLSMSERELRSLVADMRSATGRDVSPDPQFNWPRVGLADAAHVEVVVARIVECLAGPR